MKQIIVIILAFVLAVLLACTVWGSYLLITRLPWRLSSPYLMVIADSKQGKNVYLYQNGFQDRDVSLCIPLSNNPNKIKRITSWRYSQFDVILSKDNSVIAIELNDYFVAYDFDTEKLIEYNPYRTGTESASEEKNVDNQIKALINSRGGTGNVISCSSSTFVKMQYKEWQKFSKGLKAGEQEPFPVISP